MLVIDNCPSTDATRDIVAGQRGVRYVREDRPGLNNARNRALRESSHEIVAFVDDAAPDSGWLRALLHNFEDPLVYCVTGLTMPLELKQMLKKCMNGGARLGAVINVGCSTVYIAIRWQQDRWVPGQTWPSVDVLFKSLDHLMRLLMLELLPVPVAIPKCSLASLLTGYRIVYEPKALCWHRHRRTWKELSQMFYGHGVGVYAFLTRELFIQGEFGSLKIAWDWFRYDQLPSLVRSLLGRPSADRST